MRKISSKRSTRVASHHGIPRIVSTKPWNCSARPWENREEYWLSPKHGLRTSLVVFRTSPITSLFLKVGCTSRNMPTTTVPAMCRFKYAGMLHIQSQTFWSWTKCSCKLYFTNALWILRSTWVTLLYWTHNSLFECQLHPCSILATVSWHLSLTLADCIWSIIQKKLVSEK